MTTEHDETRHPDVTTGAPSAGADAGALAARGDAWLAAAAHRRSRRRFEPTAADAAALDALDEACARFRPYPDARCVLLREPAVDVFSGIIGSYGKVTGAPHVLLFVASDSAPFAQQHLGYTGEGLVLEATALGLDTCWVGGFFDRKRTERLVNLATGERVFAVTPVGHAVDAYSPTEKTMRSMSSAATRKPLADLAPALDPGWPAWARAAVEAARLAPSAVNRQPWRWRLEDGALFVARDNKRETPKVTKALDCGIAMLHAELAARAAGAAGTWTDLSGGLDVACYRPKG